MLSSTLCLEEIPSKCKGKVEVMRGPLRDAVNSIHAKGHHNLYIDGGNTIQSFLGQDLIDEMIITRFPFLLGGGAPLF